MSELKNLLEKALVKANAMNTRTTMATRVHNEYKERFENQLGTPIIWRTKGNLNIKEPQLVALEKAYENHVVVVKTAFSVDGFENKIRYSVMYNSLICQNDTFETLELI